MKIKVCGLRQQDNIEKVVALQPNFIGFIFYEKSPRFAGEELSEEYIKSIPSEHQKGGGFCQCESRAHFEYGQKI
jgi:phosphoribosylanthranilate isomerase